MTFPLRSVLFTLPPEMAHQLTLGTLDAWGRAGAPGADGPVRSARLGVRVAGVDFPNPVGVAAGLTKDARGVDGLFALGAGIVEVGTLTPLPQPGNPRPRMFRLAQDRAVVNRLGFNNDGLDAGLARAAKAGRAGVLGVNVGANKDANDRIADYALGVRRAAAVADYLTVNISSPNTPGLRDLQHGSALDELLAACAEAKGTTPLFLKVAPDLDYSQVGEIARAAIDRGVDALVVGNTTVTRPNLRSPQAAEGGGLSGRPLRELASRRLLDFRRATGGALPLVAVGGIDSGAEAYRRIRAGASLVQLYTGLIYEGPGLLRRIARELDALLERDGFASVADAVGADVP